MFAPSFMCAVIAAPIRPRGLRASAPSFLRKRVIYRVNEAKHACGAAREGWEEQEEGGGRAKSGRGEEGETRVRYGMDRRPRRRHPARHSVLRRLRLGARFGRAL